MQMQRPVYTGHRAHEKREQMCKSISDIECVEKVRAKFDSNDISSECASYCPLECEQTTYDTHLSMSDYPSLFYFKIIQNDTRLTQKFEKFGPINNKEPIKNDMFKATVLMVNVFYQELGYTLISESPAYSFETLIGIVGEKF